MFLIEDCQKWLSKFKEATTLPITERLSLKVFNRHNKGYVVVVCFVYVWHYL